CGLFEAADRASLLVMPGIAVGREDDARRGLAPPDRLGALGELAARRAEEVGQEIVLHAYEDRLRLGISEAGVELQDVRVEAAVENQPHVEDSAETPTLLRHALERWMHDARQHLARRAGIQEDRRAVRAHAAGVRTALAVEELLVVLHGGEGDRALAVAQDHERDLVALDEALHEHAVSGRAEDALVE